MEVFEAIRTRRSVRSFRTEAISDQDIARILDAARWAPSAGNKQPWTFIYIKDPQILRIMKNCSPGFYGDAPAAIIIGIDKKDEQRGVLDVCFAAQNMLLAAHALGIGSCPIVSFNGEAIRKILDAPDNWMPVLVVSLGYTDKSPEPPRRKPLPEIVCVNSFGNKWKEMEAR